MKITPLSLPEVLTIEPWVFEDDRGRFFEGFAAERYREEAGIDCAFVQDNCSVSRLGVLRGLHYQASPHAQAKLLTVLQGRIFDVAVDVRRGSSTFGAWVGAEISARGPRQIFIPAGFAHGFFALEETILFYKCSNSYVPEAERGIRWDDPGLDIRWPVKAPELSEKDQRWPALKNIGDGDLLGEGSKSR